MERNWPDMDITSCYLLAWCYIRRLAAACGSQPWTRHQWPPLEAQDPCYKPWLFVATDQPWNLTQQFDVGPACSNMAVTMAWKNSGLSSKNIQKLPDFHIQPSCHPLKKASQASWPGSDVPAHEVQEISAAFSHRIHHHWDHHWHHVCCDWSILTALKKTETPQKKPVCGIALMLPWAPLASSHHKTWLKNSENLSNYWQVRLALVRNEMEWTKCADESKQPGFVPGISWCRILKRTLLALA